LSFTYSKSLYGKDLETLTVPARTAYVCRNHTQLSCQNVPTRGAASEIAKFKIAHGLFIPDAASH